MALEKPKAFEDFSTNPAVVRKLRELYRTPADVEFYVGLFAGDTVENSPLPGLLLRMVAVDAFTQALTNPLLSERVFNEDTFSAPGWQAVRETSSLRDLVKRNCSLKSNASFVGMTQPDWSYAWPASTAVDAVRHGASLLTGKAGRNKTAGFVISTVGEVVGLVLWLQLTLAGSGAFGFTWLVAGEAIEWSLLAYMIMTSRFSHPKATGQVGAGLLKTALISLSEALLWVVWLFLIQRIGLVLATAALAVAMHVKHDAEMSVFTGRGFLKNALDSRDLVASGLEVFGAGVWYALTTAGYPILGGLVLLVCISIEHILQFVTAGFLEPEQPEHAPPPSPPQV